MVEWKTLSPLGKSLVVLAAALFVVTIGYLVITFVLIGLGSLGIGDG